MKIRFLLTLTLWMGISHNLQAKPANLSELKSAEELSQASQQSYQKAKEISEKKEKVKAAKDGIDYSEKCLKIDPKNLSCLYYNVLNRGYYIKHRIPNYQKSLKLMVKHCELLIEIDPGYEHAGCHRVLGNIYAKAPAFSLDPKSVIQDKEKAVEHFQKAVELAPDYPLNQLLLAISLGSIGENEKAKLALQKFESMNTASLDKEYPEWKEERDQLNEKLSKKTSS